MNTLVMNQLLIRKLRLGALMMSISFISSNVFAHQCDDQLFVGAYSEDPVADGVDPTPGSLFLILPPEEGAFTGQLFFTFVGCQDDNVSEISGFRSSQVLQGDWSGDVDNRPQNGTFSGTREVDEIMFSGSYTVAGGRQEVVIDDCIEYVIAPFGSWFVFPINEPTEQDELITLTDRRINWEPVSGAFITQCALIELPSDEEVAENGCVDVETIWQRGVLTSDRQLTIPQSNFTPQTNYTLTCSQIDEGGNIVSFSKESFEYMPASSEAGAVIAPVVPFILN